METTPGSPFEDPSPDSSTSTTRTDPGWTAARDRLIAALARAASHGR